MKQIICWFLIFVMLTSCIPNKKLIYFKDQGFNTTQATSIQNEPKIYLLQPGDVINVRIKTLDPESSANFNIMPDQGVFNFNSPGLYINSYSIDSAGMIELPGAGALKIGGMSIDEAQIKIKLAVHEFLNDALVIVKLVSFKITVLGEVANPGYYYVYSNQATILEGLGLAGDITDFGNRENITLIRQTDSGSKAILLNMRDSDILRSEFYYLSPGDVIYVQPLKAKSTRGNVATLNILSVFFAAVTATVLALNYIDSK
jgi:polysaccharide export outer membrane protein